MQFLPDEFQQIIVSSIRAISSAKVRFVLQNMHTSGRMNKTIKKRSTMNKLATSLALCLMTAFLSDVQAQTANDNTFLEDKLKIGARLDTLNKRAARADFDGYFDCYSKDGTFLGTDATEYWTKESFMVWSKPFFDRKRAWNFTSVERHIYVDQSGKLAWFDELLDTQMKICRGSGVLVKEGTEWKIKQYVLSMTVPNSQVDKVVPLKAPEEDSLLRTLRPAKTNRN